MGQRYRPKFGFGRRIIDVATEQRPSVAWDEALRTPRTIQLPISKPQRGARRTDDCCVDTLLHRRVTDQSPLPGSENWEGPIFLGFAKPHPKLPLVAAPRLHASDLRRYRLGKGRATIGQEVLKSLCEQPINALSRGFSVRNLKLMRLFYMPRQHRIGQSLTDQSPIVQSRTAQSAEADEEDQGDGKLHAAQGRQRPRPRIPNLSAQQAGTAAQAHRMDR